MQIGKAIRYAAAAILPGVGTIKAAQAAWLEYRSAVPRRGPVPRPENLPASFREVALGGSGEALRGLWHAGTNGAAIVLVHGAGADRRSLLVEARAFAADGYGVLAYDHPGHGESEGRPRWTEDIPAGLAQAVDWVLCQPGVQKAGVVASSMGCATTVEVAARHPGIAAVALLGAFTSAREQTMAEYAVWGLVQQVPALLVMRAFGIARDDLRPIDHVAAISPRPLLLVAGTADSVVPADMSRALFDAAGDPKELWMITGAGHGGYENAAPGEYPSRLVAFFDRSFAVAR